MTYLTQGQKDALRLCVLIAKQHEQCAEMEALVANKIIPAFKALGISTLMLARRKR
jgi:hypothetical protein